MWLEIDIAYLLCNCVMRLLQRDERRQRKIDDHFFNAANFHFEKPRYVAANDCEVAKFPATKRSLRFACREPETTEMLPYRTAVAHVADRIGG